MSNTGISYEKITKTIYENALRAQGVRNLEIKHNEHIQGQTVTHQIDVYWRFEVAGVFYQTLVQCKDWKNPVSQGDVFTFKCVLDDIPGQPRGIIMTRTGYQAGAKAYAAAHGIKTYTLREPTTDGDWQGLVREIIINVQMTAPQVVSSETHLDEAWIISAYEARGLPVTKPITVNMAQGISITDIWLYGEDDQPRQTLHDAILSVDLSRRDEHISYVFPEPTYLRTNKDPHLERVRAKGFTLTMVYPVYEHTIELKGDNIVSYILTDVQTGEKTAIDRDLQMIL